MSTDIDVSELVQLSGDVVKATTAIAEEVRTAVRTAAMDVKMGTRSRVSSHPSWKHLASTVGYDMQGSNAVTSVATIGYARGGQGSLSHIAEFGSARKAPHPALIPAFRMAEQSFPGDVTKALTQALKAITS